MAKKTKTTTESEQSEPTQEAKVVVLAPEDLVSKVSINKYDPFQLKSSIDDEICYVSALYS